MPLRLASAVAVLAAVLMVGVQSAAAQGFLDEESQESVDEFLLQLGELLNVSGDEIPSIIGEPGEDDLPPGFMTVISDGIASDDLPAGSGSELTGPCMGIAASVGPADGGGFEVIDIAADFDDPGPPIDLMAPYDSGGYAQAFTSDNPFEVHVDGFVIYAGRADPAPINHSWEIRTQGLSLDSGGDPNPNAKNRNAGTVNLEEDLPAAAKVNALFYIEGDMVADGGFSCIGSGYFKTIGGSRALEGAGVVLVLAMGVGALFNTRPARTWKG